MTRRVKFIGQHASTAHRGNLRLPTSLRDRRVGCRPAAGFRSRLQDGMAVRNSFDAPEVWHEPKSTMPTMPKVIMRPAGNGYRHPVTPTEVKQRIGDLPRQFTRNLEVVQFSGMTRKRKLFPLYGMQWGNAVYLYPMEADLIETYLDPPAPQQIVEARMYGAKWRQEGNVWKLYWTEEAVRDFYLNNILIHEIGHLNDSRNTNTADRERYANWFAIEYGYRVSRGRR